MRRREVSAFTLRAIELTGGSAEWKARTRVPTWDGRMWHFARMRHETHVLHEIAHWILSPWRELPNYGVGRDPDGGGTTALWYEYVKRDPKALAAAMRDLGVLPSGYESATELGLAMVDAVDARLLLEEETAAMLTVFLARHAGLDWMACARVCKMHPSQLTSTEHVEHLWSIAAEIASRGIDVNNPIPGLTGPTRERTA